MIVSLIVVIDVSAHAVAASFCVHNGIVRGFRWLSNSRLVSFSYTQGLYGVALVSPLVIEENGAFHFKTHLTMETEVYEAEFVILCVGRFREDASAAELINGKRVVVGGNQKSGLDIAVEWNYGGFPIWLHFIPGIELRTDNEPFKKEMQKFTAKIVDMMKQEKLYAYQGGPIILSQIENEYGNVNCALWCTAKPYIKWAASMATSLDTRVPWVMCQQSDPPDPVMSFVYLGSSS
ncbi:hypothetical protein Syun_025813 [Stephania yunnanensis]|uniref:beta-galactosidase n=1 Tax=Stephania yunnanensis TaxID=152371 RepID=A0AAP0EZH3_9MAGN